MRWFLRWSLVLLCASAIAGCAARAYQKDSLGMSAWGALDSTVAPGVLAECMAYEGDVVATALATAGTSADAGTTASPVPPSSGAAKRLMVYTAKFDILVPNPEDAVDRFLARVEALGGYLETRENLFVSCRVPAAQFHALCAEVRGYGLVAKESTSAVDVTKQFMDLTVRIENAEKARERLLVLLERAEKVEDTLKIEAEIRRLTEEIERMKGELKFLSEQIAFSTIAVQFRSNAPELRPIGRRTRSRFDWVNQIGVEHVLEKF
ncbi:MAG TPA: DUF4349 domain-containing protein [Planctomycetota bacterium]|nr:DUF4349 domain-containing protein [Planctomycetota bacterium]OQC18885.1 MAG: hypothetical protein BWX69_03177 [Planctomycetes bacterium ADurb.Bin069]NMD34932.1 DUF4349 domain-containing protein [Planctomycetota bacterium]HNR99336.1 DUF4349 domain-containing protein [Planctomycetota bacterium]HNU26804.1 DUF4349 domain-containing protein [Planctomycetota bacterium]